MASGGNDGSSELDGGDREPCGDDDGEGEGDMRTVIGTNL